MPKRLPGSREEDSWLSERQLAGLKRADQADELGSPVPTQVVSNGEYFPLPQTLQQRQVELRIAELATEASRRLSMSRRDRKSTRLNSSHLVISYAVFCLKKKKK